MTIISTSSSLWLLIVKFILASQPPLFEKLFLFSEYKSDVISNEFPITIVIFSSLGVWSIESSPINSNEPSSESSLKVLIVPLGKGMPSPDSLEFTNWILFDALMFYCPQPPALIEISLNFRIGTPYTFGMNYTCFCEDSLRVTGADKVQRW